MSDFNKLITDYIEKHKAPTKDVFTGNSITDGLLARWGFSLEKAEMPLILLNKPKAILKTSMLITNKNVYYKVLKRSFWASITQIFVRPQVQSISLEKIKHFQIGEHDSCYGTDYVGHSLEINQETVGLLRMGTGIEMNEEIIVYINSLSEYLVDKGAFQIMPKKYAWQ